LNALAGGGGFITLPALIWSGSLPILANTTGTVAVWPGAIAALYAYRRRLRRRDHPIGIYLAVVSSGSAAGAVLLLFTTNSFFMALLPWLLLFATLVFLFGRNLTAGVRAFREAGRIPPLVLYGLLFSIAVYGGYFGGGMGIMTLAVLTLIGMQDIHEMNALKSLLVVVISGVGVVAFILAGKVEWGRCIVMASGCILGGFGAGYFVQKIDPVWVRRIIALIAVSMTGYFFFRAYG